WLRRLRRRLSRRPARIRQRRLVNPRAAPTWHTWRLCVGAQGRPAAPLTNRTARTMNLLDLMISPAMAQAAGAPQPSPWQLPIMLVIFFAIFWLFIIRPQSKRAKEHREMIAALAKGDEIVTSGGIAGRV